MPTRSFTSRWVESVKPPAVGQVDYFDKNRLGKGRTFGLRVSYGGNKTWIVMYRKHGRLRRLTLGNFPDLTLAGAREKADAELAKILTGGDPAEAKQARKAAESVKELADQYIEKYAMRQKKSWKRDKEILDRDVIPAWGDRKATEIKRADVIMLLEGIVDRGAGIGANRCLEVVRKMFNWALERSIVEGNPCWQVSKPAKEKRRDRVLTDDEIKDFWQALDETDLSEQVRTALRLVLVTAQRKGEVIGAQKSEIDLKASVWTIPAERAKNGLSHRVPLSPLARSLVDEALAAAGKSAYLFPSSVKDSAPILDSAVDLAVRRNRERLKIAHFTPHDLRRTAASQIASMGISRLVIGKILNHADNSVTATYDRHSYDAEKRQALNAWGAHLQTILRGKARRKRA